MLTANTAESCLCFAYPLRHGKAVLGYAPGDVERIVVRCFPCTSGGFSVEYAILSDMFGEIPDSGFECVELSNSTHLPADVLESIIRHRIELGLEGERLGILEPSYRVAELTFHIDPAYAGRDSVNIIVSCGVFHYRGCNWQVLDVSLFVDGIDLGLMGSLIHRHVGRSFRELCDFAEAVAEGCLQKDFSEWTEGLAMNFSDFLQCRLSDMEEDIEDDDNENEDA